jgi:hypothetical protein
MHPHVRAAAEAKDFNLFRQLLQQSPPP